MNTITLDPSFKETRVLDLKKPHQKYKTSDGEMVSGTTTITGILDKPALLNWAAKVEREGLQKCYKNQEYVPDKLFYLIQRDTAANVGSCAHFIAEGWLKNHNCEFQDIEQEMVDKAYESFKKFKAYWEASGFEVVHSEIQLVSEKKRYGGTIDIIAKDLQGNLVLVDIKTSGGLYKKDMGLQMAGYKMLFEEVKNTVLSKCILVRIGKTDPEDMDIWEVPEMTPYELAFNNLLNLHHSLKKLPK